MYKCAGFMGGNDFFGPMLAARSCSSSCREREGLSMQDASVHVYLRAERARWGDCACADRDAREGEREREPEV